MAVAHCNCWRRRIKETIDAAREHAALAGYASDLAIHIVETGALTQKLGEAIAANPRKGLANATIYLDMFGHVVIGWMWLRQALAATQFLAAGVGEADHLHSKLAACRYFFTYELPKTRTQRELLASMDETALGMKEAWF
jgi:hypothetical protein